MPKKIPFHRRLMPWLFTLIFLIFAPILVFYTAGYRWNPKKGMVEKNGTVILDTIPGDANIYLNGQPVDKTTPATLQNIAPGTYTMRLEKTGYFPWEKTLSVTPERVTFANEIYLWPILEPELQFEVDVTKIFTNPNNDFLIGLKKVDGNLKLFRYERNRITEEITLDENAEIDSLSWDRSGEKALLQCTTSSTNATRLLVADPLKFSELTPARYHFERSELIGMDANYKLILTANDSFTKERHESQILDSYEELVIKKLPNEENLVLMLSADATEGLILPRGEWEFFAVDRNEMVLNAGSQWLRIFTGSNPYTTTRAEAKTIHGLTINREVNYLLTGNNELSLWRPLYEPELLYRQSDPIVAAGWHNSGYYIFFATKTEVRMMDLDSRNGRIQTVIANFDDIQDAVLIHNDVFVVGTKNAKSGLWKLPLVKTTTISPLGVLEGARIF